MTSAAHLVFSWLRKPARFLLALLRRREAGAAPGAGHGEALIYRLRHWPQIPSASKTADIYRTLSVMSNRPVNRRWILNNSSLNARAVDQFLRRLVEQDAVEVIDARRYRPKTTAA